MKRSVLVVEDEPLIAMDMEAELQDRGWSVIGPARNIPDAMQLAKTKSCSVALLDLDVSGESSVQLAEFLTSENVPVVFVSGTISIELPDSLSKCQRLSKPVNYDELSRVLEGGNAGG
jgi:DNA-binding NtrC family response regulator